MIAVICYSNREKNNITRDTLLIKKKGVGYQRIADGKHEN